MADVVVAEFMDDEIAAEVLGEFGILYDPSLVDNRNALLSALADARAIIVRNRTRVDVELLDHGPNIKVVGRLGVGLDNIDLDACKSRGVVVCPATGANDIAVAEYAIAAALILLRGVWHSGQAMLAGQWPRTDLMGREALDKRFGLIGLGSIARQVATRARALGMKVSAYDPYLADDNPAWTGIGRVSLNELASGSDVISVHVPLSEETRYIVDADFVRQMHAGAILINTARGGVVEERVVIDALRGGRLGGAALDVFESEPLDASGGAMFEGIPNLLLTPHIAGITTEANKRVSRVTAENVLKHLR